MNKLRRFEIALIGIIFLVPFVMGVVKLFSHESNYEPSVETYHAEIVDAPKGLSISGTFIEGKGYQAMLKIDTTTLKDKLLPDHLDEVKSGEEIVKEYDYDVKSNQLSASLLIDEKDVKGDISVKLTLVDEPSPVIKANITLDPGDGHFISGSETIELTLTNEQHLSDFVIYEEPVPVSYEDEFKYWLNGDEHITSKTSLENLTGDITLVAFYDVKCEHEYHYEIINKQLYSVCSKCGKTIHYSDEELTTFSGKMLVMEDGGLVLYDISELPYIVNRYMAADVYLINGEYNLSGTRDGAQVEIRVHGLNNNEGEMNATILNYAIGDDGNYYYVPLHGIKFTIDNVIMKSSFNYTDGFYFGLFSDSLICNNCRFIGKHSLYAYYVEINDSTLDSSMITSGDLTDYAMYVYSSSDVIFNRCSFDSVGKALKIYNEGITASHVVANNCIFNAHKPLLSDKAAVEIDSTHHQSNPYHIELHQCTNNGHYQLWADKSTHSEVIVD